MTALAHPHSQAAGLSVDQVAPRLSFFFAIGMNFYEVLGPDCHRPH